jgi:hypothetical protein
MKTLGTMILVVFAMALAGVRPALGGETPPPASTVTDEQIDSAFRLPPNVTLRPDQIDALTEIRNRMRPTLKEALEKAQAAKSENEKREAAESVKRLKDQINIAVTAVLNMAPPRPDTPDTKKAPPPKKTEAKKTTPKPATHKTTTTTTKTKSTTPKKKATPK